MRLDGVGNGRYVTFYGENGLSVVFVRNPDGSYASPSTVKATLTAVTGGGWTLKEHDSGDTLHFNGVGWLTAITDRRDNETTFTHDSVGNLTRVRTDLGTLGARTVDVTLDGSDRIAELTQTADSTHERSASYSYDGNGRLESITDVLGRDTSFGYNTAGDLTSITAPGGAETTFAFDAEHRVTEVSQPSAGRRGR